MLLQAGQKAHRKRQMGIYVTHEMNRVKALYRSWGIGSAGRQVYAPRHRTQWLNRIGEAGGAPAGRVPLPTAPCLASVASSRAAGSVGGEPETWGHEIVAADSVDRSDSHCWADRTDPPRIASAPSGNCGGTAD